MHHSIKEATVKDISLFKEFLVKAWHEAGQEALGWSGASDDQIEEITKEDFLSSIIARESTQIFLAYTQDEVIGFAVNSKVNQKVIELSGIIVLESMTGHGVGTALLQSAITKAMTDQATYMVVQTERTNTRAIQFYRNHGFRFQKETTTIIDGKLIELVTLELTLTSLRT